MATADNTSTSGGFSEKGVGKQNEKSGGDTKKQEVKDWSGINRSGRSGNKANG